MTPAERNLLIALARITRVDIERTFTTPTTPMEASEARFAISEIDIFRRMMDEEEELTKIAREQLDSIPHPDTMPPGVRAGGLFWPNPGQAMPKAQRSTEGYRPQPGPRPAAPNTGSGVHPPSGGSSVNRPLPFEMEAVLERKQQQVANLACALQAAWNVLTDVSIDPDVRIARAIVSLAGARP